MEYRYRQPKLTIWVPVIVISSVLLIIRVFELIQKPPLKLTYDLVFIILMVLFALTEIHYYFQNLGVVVIVDDIGITKKNRISSTTLKWSDIHYVDVQFLTRGWFGFPRPILPYFWTELFTITLKSSEVNIEIDSSISDIRNLIVTLKAKLGDIFDTKEIPVEFKYKQL